MKGTLAILAACLCIAAASAAAIPQPGQEGAAVDVTGGAAVDVSGRKLLHGQHGHDDYNYDWHPYTSYDEELYKAAHYALKVVYKSEYLLKTLFGSYYHKGYKPQFVKIVKAYYFLDQYYNKYYYLSIKFEYYGHYFTYDFIVYAPYYGHHDHDHYNYSPKYLYKIIYGNKYLKGKWSY
jgi:hypothetical protein